MDNGPRGKRLLTSIVTIAIVVAVIWVVVTNFWMWRYQERVVFQPPSANPEAPAPARRIQFRASDGKLSFGFVVAPKAERPGPRSVVIAFHGNADLAAWQVPWAQELVERSGLTVFVPEYRGYAGVPGPPTYTSAAADAHGALEYARTELKATDIVLYGHSLGSAVASELAAAMDGAGPKALVLVSPFTSARAMSSRMMVPPIPGLWTRISRIHYDTRARVAALDAPVYVSHGARDINIPVRMGRDVYAAARRPGQLLIVDGAGHNDVVEVAGERYWAWLANALAGK
jgi:fermentation-respiration switch protein FrsA (DUF1100 family)